MSAELAILGGAPCFDEPLHIGRPNVPDERRTMALIQQAIDRRWLTAFGPLVKQFERDIAAAAGVKHCVAMCNASVALQVLIRAAGLRGEVILPSFTFIATAHTLLWEGVTPVFCDIDEKTGNLDPAHARRLITDRTTAIMGVHLWGHPAPTEELDALADEHGLRLFYDSAHAIGSSRHGRPVGSFGHAEVFSFHATKFINSFEGGAVVTDDDGLAERVRSMHNYGRGEGSVVSSIGTNAKMTEVAAAMGIVSLENMAHLIDVNRGHHTRYAEGLAGVPGVVLRAPLPGNRINHQYVVVEIDEPVAGVGRDALAAALTADNVLVRTHFDPGCHRTAPYAQAPQRHAPLPLPHTEALGSRVVMLPTGSEVTSAQVDQVCALIRRIVDRGEAVAAAAARN
ncbi:MULTISPECIES: DegT/DnrJ/EryC1/StrS family aminotransferase [Streptomyces]|uniref:DegT/DnrJ/EryC1/StrS family aminotransferase n=1 Tax=Streptomyces fimbriatus TaxID=68197 RepID=A0ABW0DHX4_STRFI